MGRPGSCWLRSASAGLGGNEPAKSGTEEATPPALHFLEWEDCLLAEGRYGRYSDPAHQARCLGIPRGIHLVHGASCGTSTLRVQ